MGLSMAFCTLGKTVDDASLAILHEQHIAARAADVLLVRRLKLVPFLLQLRALLDLLKPVDDTAQYLVQATL